MTPLPRSEAGRCGLVGRHLEDLGRQLGELTGRVRRAVAEVLREFLAQLARDAVDHCLAARVPAVPWRASPPPPTDDPGDDFDPWAEDTDAWAEPPGPVHDEAVE